MTSDLEHLTPHDVVTYSRCPYEMELARAQRLAQRDGSEELHTRTPPDVVPLRQSPLLPPIVPGTEVEEGRLDLERGDALVYEDEAERDLPVLFAPDAVRLDPRFRGRDLTLIDAEFGLAGRPDLVVRRADGSFFPIECKATHLFTDVGPAHGRPFDMIQSLAECRLVHAAFGLRPSFGVVLYADRAGSGAHEGWTRVPYGDAEGRWLARALGAIRADRVRAPVPSERHCAPCGPNRNGLCAYAAARPGEGAPGGARPPA